MLDYIDIGNGEEIVFIHGLGNTKEAWFPQLSLSEKYRLIIIELRGHGQSIITEDLKVETFAKDILEVLDFLDIQKAHFCGLSLGGLVAQEIHKQAKERVKSLILCNTTFYIPTILGDLQIEQSKNLINNFGYKNFEQKSIDACLYNNQDLERIKLANQSFKIREDTYIGSASAAFGRNYYFDLLDINVPTTIIGSLEDKIVPVQNASLMNLFIKKSNLVIFKNAGHLSNIDKTEEFNQSIESHINHYINN